MAWNLKGSYAETCSCELMCPCNLSFDHGATYDYCRATLAFHIREGEVEGTDVRGRRVVTIIDTPKVMTDGNWRLGMFVDDQATDEQFDKLPFEFKQRSDAYRDGLNAYIRETRTNPTKLPAEYAALGVPAPAEWTTRDMTAIGVYLARTVPSGDGHSASFT